MAWRRKDTAHARSDTTCGALLIGAFLENPRAPLDTGCLADSRPIDFEGTPQIAAAYFGTATVWGD
jgi:hypothetical protein